MTGAFNNCKSCFAWIILWHDEWYSTWVFHYSFSDGCLIESRNKVNSGMTIEWKLQFLTLTSISCGKGVDTHTIICITLNTYTSAKCKWLYENIRPLNDYVYWKWKHIVHFRINDNIKKINSRYRSNWKIVCRCLYKYFQGIMAISSTMNIVSIHPTIPSENTDVPNNTISSNPDTWVLVATAVNTIQIPMFLHIAARVCGNHWYTHH